MKNQKWPVFTTISFVYVFLNMAAFNTLGVVLYYMIESLDWSFSDAFFSYTVMGVACGLGSLLPLMMLKKFGARITASFGCFLLLLGFGLCAFSSNLIVFYIAMALIGAGFAGAGNLPAMWIIGSWFPKRSPRMIGFYMMSGAAGAIVGPYIVQAIVSSAGWRFYWGLTAVIALLCLALAVTIVRDKKTTDDDKGEEGQGISELSFSKALMTPEFAVAAIVITLLLTTVTTISSTATSHLTQFGFSAKMASISLGVYALAGTIAKGASGALCEKFSARKVLIIGSVLQGLGILTLSTADTTVLLFAWGALYGAGWGASYVSTAVLLFDYFGNSVGARLFSGAHILATLAALGPWIAGTIADAYGTFSPFFYVCGVLFIVAVIPIMALKKPKGLDKQAVNAVSPESA